MAVQKRTYSSGKFALEIDGKPAGWPKSMDGGAAHGLVTEKANTSGPPDKSIGDVSYDDITFTCSALDPAVAGLLSKFLKGQAPVFSGAFVLLDFNYQEVRRLAWDKASISSVTLPGLAGESKDPVVFSITVRPESTRWLAGVGGSALNSQGKQSPSKTMLRSNFSLSIPGMNCTHVSAIEPITISQSFVDSGSRRGVPKPGPLQIGDLVVTVTESGLPDFMAWNDDFLIKGNNGAAQEKSAAIRLLSTDLKTELMAVNLTSIGLYRLNAPTWTQDKDSIPRWEASMYCEQVDLVFPAQESAPTPPAVPAEDGPSNLRGFLGIRLETEEVARRLRDTRDQPLITSESDRQRQLGMDLGVAWAERRGSLAEVEELGSLGDDWSSIVLPAGHSLSEVLVATGVVPDHYDGELELWRDSMTDGLMAGILKVMAEVSKDVTANLK